MINKIDIHLINKDASMKLEASLFYKLTNDNSALIELKSELHSSIIFQSNNFFKALVELRNWLYDNNKLFPCVKGALIDVYPSRMSIQMANGLNAYSLKISKQTSFEDLINIFDTTNFLEEKKLSTVEDQKIFYLRWLKSL